MAEAGALGLTSGSRVRIKSIVTKNMIEENNKEGQDLDHWILIQWTKKNSCGKDRIRFLPGGYKYNLANPRNFMKLRQNGGGALYVCTHTNGGGALHLCGPANFARPPHNKQAKNPKSCAHRDKLDQNLNTYTDFSLARQHSAASKRSKRPSSRTGVSSLSMNLGSWNRRSIPNCNSVLSLVF